MYRSFIIRVIESVENIKLKEIRGPNMANKLAFISANQVPRTQMRVHTVGRLAKTGMIKLIHI